MDKIVVLYGGVSPEREVSLNSGAAVAEALNDCGWEAQLYDIKSIKEFVKPWESFNAGGVFIALHGGWGENGRIQTVLEALEIPYTGSGPEASMTGMDKRPRQNALRRSRSQRPRRLHGDARVRERSARRGISEKIRQAHGQAERRRKHRRPLVHHRHRRLRQGARSGMAARRSGARRAVHTGRGGDRRRMGTRGRLQEQIHARLHGVHLPGGFHARGERAHRGGRRRRAQRARMPRIQPRRFQNNAGGRSLRA